MKFKQVLVVWISIVFPCLCFADTWVVTELAVGIGNTPEPIGCGQAFPPADSNTVVGTVISSTNTQLPFYWNRSERNEQNAFNFPLIGDGDNGDVLAINRDLVSTGYSDDGPTLDDFFYADSNGRLITPTNRFPRIAVRWDENRNLFVLGALTDGRESMAHDINDAGVIVGQSESNQTLIPFDYFNDADAIQSVQRSLRHAFRYDNDVMENIADISVVESAALAINNNGTIVGWVDRGDKTDQNLLADDGITVVQTRSKPIIHAAIWRNGANALEIHPATSAITEDSAATDINDAEKIVGWIQVGNAGIRHAYLWDGNNSGDIHNTSGDRSEALAINNKNQIVGIANVSTAGGLAPVGFLYEPGVGMKDFNDPDLLDSDSAGAWVVTRALHINDNGVATGCVIRKRDIQDTNIPVPQERPALISPAVVDLVVNGSGVPNPVVVDNILRYNIAVGNLGPNKADNVVLTVILPAKIQFVSAIPQFGSCTQVGSTVTCRLTTLIPNSINLVLISVKPTDTGGISLSASVDSDQTDTDLSNNNLFVQNNANACFIATAAYGSYLDPHVVHLRQFRDKILKPMPGGEALIHFYYRHSPPLAQYIQQRSWAKSLTRIVLTPLVMLVAYPFTCLLLVLSMIGLWQYRRRLINTH